MAPTLISVAELTQQVRHSEFDAVLRLWELVANSNAVLVGDTDSRQALADIIGQVGIAIAPPLILLACEPFHDESVRALAVESLRMLIAGSPHDRPNVIRYLDEFVRVAALKDDCDLAPTIQTVIQLQAKELASAMHRLFSQNRINTQAVGSWQEVRQRLQIEDHDLMQEFEAAADEENEEDDEEFEDDDDFIDDDSEFSDSAATSVFSALPVFDKYGELTSAYEEYSERAFCEFRQSPEWGQTTENGMVVRELLRYGAEYEGLLVDEMTASTIRDYLFRHFPKTIIVEPAAAAAILAEMQRFWEFMDREYQLPDARPILEWLNKSSRLADLETVLKRHKPGFDFERIIMAEAERLGYDLTNPEGRQQFLQDFNRSAQTVDRQPTEPAVELEEEFDQPVTYVSDQPKVGRNEPCPCGSGKKFKKCCQRHDGHDEMNRAHLS
ncbi:MAG: DUF1186 domain-containing protein [Pirellulales bacterium]